MILSGYQHLESHIEQGVLVLTIAEKELVGEELCTALREELLHAFTESGVKKVVIDFRHVKLVASVAFRPLLGLRRKLQDVGAQMAICNLSPVVAEIFHATGLLISSRSAAPLFEEKPDVPAAIAFLNGVPAFSGE